MKQKSWIMAMIRLWLGVLVMIGFIVKSVILGVAVWMIWGVHHLDFPLPFEGSMPLQIRYSGWINYQQGFYSIHRLEIGSEGIEWFRIQDCRLFYTADSCWIHIRQAEVDYPKSAEWIKQNFPSESNPAKPGSEFHFSRLICRRIQIDKLELTGLTPHPIRLDLKAEVDHEKNGVGWRIRRLNPVLTADRGGSWGCEGRVEAGHDSGWVYRIQASDSLDKFRVGFNGNFYTSPFRIDYQGHIMGHQIKDWLSLPDTIQFLGRLDLQDIQLDLEGTADTAQINVHHLKSRLTKIMGSPLELELENAGYEASTRNLNWRQLMLEWDGLRIYGNGRLNLDSLIMDGDYQMDWTRLPIRIPDLVTAGGGTLVFSHFVLTDPRADWIDFSFDIGGFYRDYPIKLGGSGRIQLNNPWISLVYGNGHINSLEWNARGWGRTNGTEFRLRTDLVGTSIRENPGGSVILADSLIAHIGVVRSRSAPPMVQIELNTPRISVDEIQIENMRAVTRNWNVMDLRSGEFELSMDQVKIQDATLVSSLSMKTMVMPNRHLDLHPIRIHLPGNSRLDLNGTLDPTHRPWSLTLENSRLELDRHFYPIAGSQPIRMDSLQRISVDSLMMMVGQSAIYLGGWYDLKTRDGSVTVNCTQLEIPELSPIIPLQEMTLVKTGRLSLTGVLELDSGTVHRADLHARARKLLWDEVSVDEIELKADWSNGRIRINDLQARDYNHHLEFHGVFDSIPSAWYLTGTLEGDGEIPFYLSRYIPDVYLLTGRYRISAGCTGPVRDLNWQGTLKIDSTELFLNVLETPIRNIRLDSHFSRDTLWVDSVSGWTVSSSQHKKNFWNLFFHSPKPADPALTGTGWWAFQDATYHFSVAGNGVDIEYLPVKLDLTADCQLDLSNRGGMPRVDGEIQLNRFNLRDDFSNYVSQSDTATLFYHIILSMPKNIWIKNKYLNMETGGMLELSLEANMDLPEVYGDLTVRRGQVFFYGYSFKIESGKLNFKSAAELNPEFDILASTRIQDLRIQLNVTGTLKKPEFTLSSSPISLSQEELMMIFFSSQRSGTSQSGIGAGTERVLTGLVSQRISQSGIRYLGVDHFNLDPNDPETPYSGFNSMLDRLRFSSLTIGKYLTPNIFLTYSGQLTLSGDKSISVEYLLNENVSIVGEKKTDGRYRMGIRMKYSY